MREFALTGAIRQQAGSYRGPRFLGFVGDKPTGDSRHAEISVDCRDSPAGWLLQGDRFFVLVRADLPANRGVREFALAGAIRQQAGSYKGTRFLEVWGLNCRRS